MLPTLRPGEHLLVRRGAPVRVGDVVVGRFVALPDVLVVKRVVGPSDQPGCWLLGSDNPAVEGHGVTSGPGRVEGVVRWRRAPGGLPRRVV